MIYELLHNNFNLVKYISFRATGAAITALIICFLIGPRIIRTLVKHQYGETIRKIGPKSHLEKEGTPSMGGIIIILSIILPTILWARLDNKFILLMLFSTLWMGLIGFVDDYMKIKLKKSKGLIARYKLLGQISLGFIISYFLFKIDINNYFLVNTDSSVNALAMSNISVPFLANGVLDIGILYVPLIILTITATSNAVNLTDGLDGLATGLVAISALVFAAIAYASGRIDYSNYLNIVFIPYSSELFIYCFALIGACIGFLWYNAYPAKIFMGDVGSLSLGSALGTLAILLKKELLLIIIGGVFVLEALSVIFQISYFRITKKKYKKGKRLFKMAPLHHHFELIGWKEPKIIVRFWIITFIFVLIGLSLLKIR